MDGFDPGSDGTLTMNGGTVSVSGMFGLGWNGGKEPCMFNGGTFDLSRGVQQSRFNRGRSVGILERARWSSRRSGFFCQQFYQQRKIPATANRHSEQRF